MSSFKQKIMESTTARKALAWLIVHAPRMVPITPLRQSHNWLAFCHPAPSYPVHIVILPRRPWKDWLAVTTEDPEVMMEFVILTQSMIRDFELAPAGYRLIMNGGPNQTFPHLHFHLVAGDECPSK